MVALEDIKELEQALQQSINEAEASDRKRKGIPDIPVEQRTRMQVILARLEQLPGHFPQKMTPESVKFFGELSKVLVEAGTEADVLRAKFEGNKNSESIARDFQVSRQEDLATMIHYLDKVSQQVADLVQRYEDEMQKQASHREAEQKMIDRVNKVLQNYE